MAFVSKEGPAAVEYESSGPEGSACDHGSVRGRLSGAGSRSTAESNPESFAASSESEQHVGRPGGELQQLCSSGGCSVSGVHVARVWGFRDYRAYAEVWADGHRSGAVSSFVRFVLLGLRAGGGDTQFALQAR